MKKKHLLALSYVSICNMVTLLFIEKCPDGGLTDESKRIVVEEGVYEFHIQSCIIILFDPWITRRLL